jgi:hypothetical protein
MHVDVPLLTKTKKVIVVIFKLRCNYDHILMRIIAVMSPDGFKPRSCALIHLRTAIHTAAGPTDVNTQ